MGTRWIIVATGLFLVLVTACYSGEPTVVVPAQNLGTLTGSVNIGPLCPVEPCSTGIGDTYSSRQIQLTGQGVGDVVVYLNHDGTFNAQVPTGRYQVTLSNCIYLGCASSNSEFIEIIPSEVFVLQIDIDTGIRSAVQPPASESPN